MLEVNILKVVHSGEHNAKKTLPYIKECDVFGPEMAYAFEAEAQECEKTWENILKLDSRTKFRQQLKFTHSDEKESAFWMKVYEYAYLQKIPCWIIERFSQEENKQLMAQRDEINELEKQTTIQYLLQGDLDNYIRERKSLDARFRKITEIRDSQIVQQLNVAEKRIRERYPSLKAKDSLRYTIVIGCGHTPENLVDFPVQVYDLINKKSINARFSISLSKNDQYPELDRDIVALGILKLSENKYIQTVTENQVRDLNLEELAVLLKNHK